MEFVWKWNLEIKCANNNRISIVGGFAQKYKEISYKGFLCHIHSLLIGTKSKRASRLSNC